MTNSMNDTAAVIDRFHSAFLEHDPGRLQEIIAEDCVMEGVGPAPEGNRWMGYAECLAGWQEMASDHSMCFEHEAVEVHGDRGIIRWRLEGAEEFRGVTLMRVRDGQIVEALGYAKRP